MGQPNVGPGFSLAQCQECHGWYHRDVLVRGQQDSGTPWGHGNFLAYSNYHATGWACTCVDFKGISMGVDGDRRISYDFATNAQTIVNGAQTWKGSGQLYTKIAVDASAWDSLCFWVNAGANEQEPEATQGLTVEIGVCGPSYATPQAFRTFTFTGGKRLWFTTPVSAITVAHSALYFYLNVTASGADQLWWAERAQVDKNLAYPEGCIVTAGHSIYYDPASISGIDMGKRVVKVVCPNCKDKIGPRTHGPARKEILPEIPYSGGQEV